MDFLLNLQLFAEGGSSSAGAEGSGTGEIGAAAGSSSTGEAEVLYGVQPDAEAQGLAAGDKEAKNADEATSAEKTDKVEKTYTEKDLQKIIKARTARNKAELSAYKAIRDEGLMELLSERYGVDASDVKALTKALSEDDARLTADALEMGVSKDAMRQIRANERETARLKAQIAREAEEKEAARVYSEAEATLSKWRSDSEGLKTVYPDFDFDTEMQNEQFVKFLSGGMLTVKQCYELCHHDEIMTNAMNNTAAKVSEAVRQNIIARGRPVGENGSVSSTPATVKDDPNNLTYADLDEIKRRISRGEKISFSR